MIIKTTGGQTNEVRYTGGPIDSTSDLDWGGIWNCGADSEAVGYLLNHDGACDYCDIIDPTEIEACEVFGKGNTKENTDEKSDALLNNFGAKCKGCRESLFRK